MSVIPQAYFFKFKHGAHLWYNDEFGLGSKSHRNLLRKWAVSDSQTVRTSARDLSNTELLIDAVRF